MKTIARAYSEFGALMEDSAYLSTPNLTFAGVCAHIGVSPSSLNEVLRKELGFYGPDILEYFQKFLNL